MSERALTLNYSYPDLGKISVDFYSESKQVLEFLEKVHPDGLRHFERLDHLGRIRDVQKSAHHSRWEYVFLQMYLFHELKDKGASFGFGKSIKLNKNTKISSAEELLKCWSLLLNFGHLEGTFESERAWFEELKEDEELLESFLDYLPDEDCKKVGETIFSEENYYKFYELISLFLLSFYKSAVNCSSTFPIEKFILMVKRYLMSARQGTAIHRCKNIFRRVRKLAYILLDSAYSATFFKINPKIFFDYIIMNSEEVLYDDYSDFNKTLDSVASNLFNELYSSKQATIFKFRYLLNRRQKIQTMIQVDRQNLTEQLSQELVSSIYSDDTKPYEGELHHILRLNFLPGDEYFKRSDCKYYTEQKTMVHKMGFNDFYPLVTPGPGINAGSILDIFSKHPFPAKKVPRLIWTLLHYTRDIFAEWDFIETEYIFQKCVEDPVEDIFLFLLGLLLPSSSMKVMLNEDTSPDDYSVNLITGKARVRSWVDRITDDMEESDLSNSRKKEVECLKWMIAHEKRGMIIVSHCNVEIYDEHWVRKAEWDGVYFRILPQVIYINILESKAGMSPRSWRAERDLLESFEKIGLKVEPSKLPIKTRNVKRKSVGFSYLKANFVDLLPSEIIS